MEMFKMYLLWDKYHKRACEQGWLSLATWTRMTSDYGSTCLHSMNSGVKSLNHLAQSGQLLVTGPCS